MFLAQAQREGQIEKPGEADRRNFKLHWSVDFWRHRGYGADHVGPFAGVGSDGSVTRCVGRCCSQHISYVLPRLFCTISLVYS